MQKRFRKDIGSILMAMQCCSYDLKATCGDGRVGEIRLPHGVVPTPCFMPVGTRGTIRGVSCEEVREAGASMVLANTYHLWVRPGHEIVQRLGGLHTFMNWSGPILTDSGGYQVFSLRDRCKVTEEGVRFCSPEDGQWRLLTPERSIEIQEALGVDVAMAFDECLEWPATRQRAIESTERTSRWLKRCMDARRHPEQTALFGIVQGGTFEDLRRSHAQEIRELPLDGYAVGGLAVGEDRDSMIEMVGVSTAELPSDKPRYLMGVGYPHDMVDAVMRGIDLFDCVLPTRAGRHATAFTSVGKLNLKNACHKEDPNPVDPNCACPACTRYSRAYLRHLFKAEEMLAKRLLSVHNLTYYQRLLQRLRMAITAKDVSAIEALRSEAERAAGRKPQH